MKTLIKLILFVYLHIISVLTTVTYKHSGDMSNEYNIQVKCEPAESNDLNDQDVELSVFDPLELVKVEHEIEHNDIISVKNKHDSIRIKKENIQCEEGISCLV